VQDLSRTSAKYATIVVETKSCIIKSILQILLRHCLKGGDILIPDQLVDDSGFTKGEIARLGIPA
jgi:hypothetical protein